LLPRSLGDGRRKRNGEGEGRGHVRGPLPPPAAPRRARVLVGWGNERTPHSPARRDPRLPRDPDRRPHWVLAERRSDVDRVRRPGDVPGPPPGLVRRWTPGRRDQAAGVDGVRRTGRREL